MILWKEQDLETQPTFVLAFGLCASFLVALNWELWKIICPSYDTGAFLEGLREGGSTAGGPLQTSSYRVREKPHLHSPPPSPFWRHMHTRAHTYKRVQTYCSMAGPSCCPKAWNTTFVCLRLVFFPWTLLTFILQLKVLEVPPAVGGKLSLDENELRSSLPRHRLVCLYLHYPAIPQLPLFLSFFPSFFSSYHHLLQLASYVTL